LLAKFYAGKNCQPLRGFPLGRAFLAELPFKAASAACCRYSATDEGRRLFLDFPNIFDKKFLKIKRCDLFSI